jgi:DNA-binding winged helix-turn-helix (wHTH) protein
MNDGSAYIYELGDFRFDPSERTLQRSSRPVLPLTDLEGRVLTLLLERAPSVVTRRQFFDEIWRGQAVGENNLNQQIAQLRNKLGNVNGKELIKTRSKLGYFVNATVKRVPRRPSFPPTGPSKANLSREGRARPIGAAYSGPQISARGVVAPFAPQLQSRRVAVYGVRPLDRWPYETVRSIAVDDIDEPLRLPEGDDLRDKFRCFGGPEQFLEWGLVPSAPDLEAGGRGRATWLQVEYVLFRSTERFSDARIARFRDRLIAEGISDQFTGPVVPTMVHVGAYNDPHFEFHELGGEPGRAQTYIFVTTVSDIPYLNAHTMPQSLDYHLMTLAEVVDFRQHQSPPTYRVVMETYRELHVWYLKTGGEPSYF